MKQKFQTYTIVFLIACLALLYNARYINDFPSHIHAWAQADRYALAMGFLRNDFRFFKPETYVYNHQFPYGFMKPSDESITAVDFPVHDFVPALCMKLLNNTSPWVFRGYILIFSLAGLYFLFRLAYKVTNNYYKAIFILVFAATSPVFVYYQGSFLPTIPSLSLTITGLWFYYLHLLYHRNKHFLISILMLALATLARMTFAIPFIAVLCVEFIKLVKKETCLFPKLIPVGLAIMALFGYRFFAAHVRETYGSMFLNFLLPPSSIEEVGAILRTTLRNWEFDYFSRWHYLILLAAFTLFAGMLIMGKIRFMKANRYLMLFSITCLFGCLLFAFAMMRQFPDHDYYFLDSFYLPMVLFLMLFPAAIPIPRNPLIKRGLLVVAVTLSILLIIQPLKSQERRRHTGFWDKTEMTIGNYADADLLLDSLGVRDDAKILVLDAVAPNLPFLLLERKGYALMTPTRENFEITLEWDYDYLIFQNEYFVPEIFTSYPEIVAKTRILASNGKISVCTRSSVLNPQSLPGYFDLEDQIPIHSWTVASEDSADSVWMNINSSDRIAPSGKFAGSVAPDMEYGFTFQTKQSLGLEEKSRILYFSSTLLCDSLTNGAMVASIQTERGNLYYKQYELDKLMTSADQWQDVSLLFWLPAIPDEPYAFSLYFWNTGRSSLFYDDLKIKVY